MASSSGLALDAAMDGHHPCSHHPSSYTVPLYDTTALTAALANPYSYQHVPSHMSPHYYQACVQAYSRRTTADGYTLSSTYVPGIASQTTRTAPSAPIPSLRGRPSAQAHPQTTAKPILNHLTYGSWYQPGNCRCTRQRCPFTGSRKSVEIHMMDRHFIFPPGWEKKNDWDADPSLKGKSIAVQGTSLVLDTPETISAWIAERKRRFPTDEKIQDKKRKLEEAAARGQLSPADIGAGARKKHKRNMSFTKDGSKRFRGQEHQGERGRRWEGRVLREGPRVENENVDNPTSQTAGAKAKCTRQASPGSDPIADDDDAPEVMSSRLPTALPCIRGVDVGRNSDTQMVTRAHSRRMSQPKNPPRNPFASRPTLLRNLLLPEIRVTVSNLSQAIRFLVENDFLRDVELRPGEAQEQMIEVLGSNLS